MVTSLEAFNVRCFRLEYTTNTKTYDILTASFPRILEKNLHGPSASLGSLAAKSAAYYISTLRCNGYATYTALSRFTANKLYTWLVVYMIVIHAKH